MRLSNLIGPDLRESLANDPEGLKLALEEVHSEDIAGVLDEVSTQEAVTLMQALPREKGAEVLCRVSPELQALLVEGLGTEVAADLLLEMPADDRVDLRQSLPEELATALLAQLEAKSPEVAEEVRQLQAWPEDSAAGRMTTEFVSLPPDMKAWEAIDAVRERTHEEHAETVYYLYVTGYGGKLLGVVSLRDLILADPSSSLQDIMTENVTRVLPTHDQEHVADMMARYDFSVLPVVQENGRMLGVITIDDVVDVVIEEATEDAQMMGGVVPLAHTYFSATLLETAWKRGVWLVLLFLGQLLTTSVMERNEATMMAMIELAIFIPLIIASGGNSGGQSSSLIIRALAVGEMHPRDWLRVMARELTMGLLLGCFLGVIGFARAMFTDGVDDPEKIGYIVGVSVTAVVTLGTLVGSMLPLAIQRVGLDPAVSSTPFVASLVDVLGLMLYFGVAHWMLTMLV